MNTRTILSLSMMLVLAVSAGCGGGRGKHVTEGINAANARIQMLKAGTEWQMAEQAFLAGDLSKALTKVDNSLKINDTVVKSHVLRGRILIEQGRMGEALKSLKLAQTYGPLDPDANYYLAIVFERLGEIDLARIAFQTACENDDMNPAYAIAAAEMFIAQGQLDDAVAYLNSTPIFEHHAGIRQTLGHVALMQEHQDVAVRYFQEAQLLSPDDTEIQEDLITAYVEAGRFADANSDLVAMMSSEDFGARRDLMHLRARCLMELDRPAEARSMFQELTAGDAGGDDIDAWIGLGNCAYLIGDDRTLRRTASRVIAAAPNMPDGYTLMALYQRRMGSIEDALSSIEGALDADSNIASAHAFRGLLLSDLGEHIASIEAFKIATELEPENPDYRAMLDWANLGEFATVPTDGP